MSRSTRRSSADSVLGEYLYQEGSESVYECRVCGGSRLMVNEEKGLFHCWTCSAHGIVGERRSLDLLCVPSPKVYHNESFFPFGIRNPEEGFSPEQQATWDRICRQRMFPSDSEAFVRYRILLQDRGPLNQGLVFPCRSQTETSFIGYQRYAAFPEMGSRYMYQGTRGIALASTTQKDCPIRWDQERDRMRLLILAEGFWTTLRLFHLLMEEGIDCWVGITFGTMISDFQFSEILQVTDKSTPVVVAFDNDAPGPAYTLAGRLSPYRETAVCFPRKVQGCKDWDDLAVWHLHDSLYELLELLQHRSWIKYSV